MLKYDDKLSYKVQEMCQNLFVIVIVITGLLCLNQIKWFNEYEVDCEP